MNRNKNLNYGMSWNDFACSTIHTADGGYAMVGYSGSVDGNVTGNQGNEDSG